MTVTFIAPDLPHPSGGLRVIHALAASLDRQGVPAKVWHGDRYRVPTGDLAPAPVVCADSLAFVPGDILVMTEINALAWAPEFSQVPVVLHVQGPDFVFAGIEPGSTAARAPYPGWPNATAVIAASRTLETLMEETLAGRLPLFRIPVVVDTDLFAPAEKDQLIAYMPRRRMEEMVPVLNLLSRREEMQGWDLLPIDGMTREQVAEALGRSAIFLSGAEREGFGLPGAEALAAGAAVVGFSGHGGTEYMADGRATVIPEGDAVAMMRAVLAEMEAFENDRRAWDSKREDARQFIGEEFCGGSRDAAALRVFTQLLADGAPSRITESVELRHFSAYEVRGALPRARVAVRSALGGLRRRIRG